MLYEELIKFWSHIYKSFYFLHLNKLYIPFYYRCFLVADIAGIRLLFLSFYFFKHAPLYIDEYHIRVLQILLVLLDHNNTTTKKKEISANHKHKQSRYFKLIHP